jgi:hypothetical protein
MKQNIKVSIFCVIFVLAICKISITQDRNEFRFEDKIRIKEAMEIASRSGDSLWENWSNVPFTLLLITSKSEFLINYPDTPTGFKSLGFDSLLQWEVYYRGRKFDARLLATFPVVGSTNTIVVGQPENTGLSSGSWVITLLHEHFHQYQYSQPGYYDGVAALDLAGSDNTGMWMLNYPFPYENDTIGKEYNNLVQLAKETAFSKENKFNSKFQSLKEEQEKFRRLLSKKDYAYFSFQLWQEGIARYTEYKMTRMIMNNFKSSYDVAGLKDFVPYDSLYKELMSRLVEEADSLRLDQDKRVCFYSMGALIGLILDRVNPKWHDMYFKEKFYLEKYF